MFTVAAHRPSSTRHPLHPSRLDRKTGLLPEMAVVLASVRSDVEGMAELLERLGPGLHWPLVVALAEREMATPVLLRRLRQLRKLDREPKGLDPSAFGHLARLAMVHEFRILEMERRLGELLDVYEEEGIHVLLLKGAALWHTVYKKPADRPMGDVDVLVEPDRADDAWELARIRGWGRVVDTVPMEVFDEHQHMARLYDESGLGLGLEIHTDLFPEWHPFHFATADLWTHAEPLPDRDYVHVPAPGHLLLHNSVHFAWSHAFGYGVWKAIRDTEALLRRGEVELDRFAEEARRAQAASCAFWTLHLAQAWSGVPVPDDLLGTLGRPVPALALAPLRRHLAAALTTQPEHGLPVRLGHALWEAAVRPGRSGHGDIRPWSHGEVWAAEATDPETQAAAQAAGDAGEEGRDGEEGSRAGTGPLALQEPSALARSGAAVRHLVRLATGR